MTTGRIVVSCSSGSKRKDLRAALESQRYEVTEAETAGQTIQETDSGVHHVVILDSAGGLAVTNDLCRAIRRTSDLGIIILSSDNSTQGRIDALNAGADDFITEPFALEELMARVRAILRRVTSPARKRGRVSLEDRAIDLQSHTIQGPGDRMHHLTPKEFYVLKDLLDYPGQSRTVRHLAQTIWQRDGTGEVEYVRIVIRQLRRKLEPDPDNPRYILTERTAGYRFALTH